MTAPTSALTSQRLREAADTLEMLSRITGHPHPAYPMWNAVELRREAEVLEQP